MGKSVQRARSVLWLFLAGLAASEPLAFAQTTTPDLSKATLEQLMAIPVTTASRTAEVQTVAPARVQVVTAAQIERRGYRSLLDVLRDLPDFKVDLRGNWDFPAEITVQGVRGASRVIVLLDGIRVSAPTNEPLPIVANYPVHNARQIEIVYGPASAVYGADAFSAVINVITHDAAEAPGLSTEASVGSFGLFNQTASYGTAIGRGNLVIGGQYQYDRQPDLSRFYPADFNGLQAQHAGVFPTIFGVMTPSAGVSPDYHIPMWARSLNAGYRNGGLQLSVFENKSHLPTTAGVYTPDNVVYDDVAFNVNHLIVASGTYTRLARGVTSTSTLTYSRHNLDADSGYRDLYSNMNRSYKYAFGSMLEAQQQFAWKPANTVTMTTGATLQRFFSIPQTADLNAPVQSQATPGTILGTNLVDEFFKLHYVNTGAFAEMRWAMSPAMTMTAGGRADYNTRYGGTFNPRVGLVAQATPSTTVKVLYGTAYLAPSPYQAYQHYGSFLSDDGGVTFYSPFWHLPNPDLRPQHKQTFETSVSRRLGGTINLTGSLFYSHFSNLIVTGDDNTSDSGIYLGWPVADTDITRNQGREVTYGGSFGVDVVRSFAATGQLSAYANLSLVDGRIWPGSTSGPHYQIGGMAPVQLRAGGDMDWNGWSLAPRLTLVGAQRLLAFTDGDNTRTRRTIDGFWTADLNVRRHDLFKSVDAFVTTENLFDRRYRTVNERAYINPEEFIGIPQNPRRITVGLALRVK